jgi:hypothetical protein
MSVPDKISSFAEFWPYYVGEHLNPLNRKLHFIGSTLGAATAIGSIVTGQLYALPLAPVLGYGFAWVGHFFVEKNKPASFKYPLYSFMGDWVMWYKIVTGTMDEEVRRVESQLAEVTPIERGASVESRAN